MDTQFGNNCSETASGTRRFYQTAAVTLPRGGEGKPDPVGITSSSDGGKVDDGRLFRWSREP
jgi:hypothetical protein